MALTRESRVPARHGAAPRLVFLFYYHRMRKQGNAPENGGTPPVGAGFLR